ncbi:hypothetical protein PVAP13_9KG365401 [Panicum virgatum]|uniref:Uncharacterized protein n=1 Tax=Panicum virgatum TaxID=38727 RepID=A0A8T0NV06_PANVG|nr:hypothetical protein PVAP13_9KG365401 [Panicum virgatum]
MLARRPPTAPRPLPSPLEREPSPSGRPPVCQPANHPSSPFSRTPSSLPRPAGPRRTPDRRGHGAAAVGAGAGAGLRRQAGQGRRRRRGPAGHGGRVVVPGRAAAAAAAAAAAGVRDARGPARDGAPGAAQRRPPPGLRGVRRAQGDRALPGRLLARLHGVPPRHPPRLTGSGRGAGRVHGGLRPRRLRRERPQPGSLRALRGAGHGGARRRAGPRRQVLRRRLLPRLPRRVGRAQVHPAQAGGRRDAGARGQLLVARLPGGHGGGGVRPAGARRPVGPARVSPRPRDPPLVDGPAVAAHLHRRRQHHAPPQQARRRGPPRARRRRHAPAEAGGGDAAGDPRVLLPGHDGHVRQVGVRSHEPAGAAVPRAPVAGRRGRPRAGRAAAPPRREARLGQLPRAPRHRPLPLRRPRPRGHRASDTFRVSHRKAVVVA